MLVDIGFPSFAWNRRNRSELIWKVDAQTRPERPEVFVEDPEDHHEFDRVETPLPELVLADEGRGLSKSPGELGLGQA